MISTMSSNKDLKAIYCQADRCWRTNNFKSCLQLCDRLSRLLRNDALQEESSIDLSQMSNLVWFLKIKCLSEDHFVDESLLLNEDDIESDEQVQTYVPDTRQSTTRRKTAQTGTSRAFGELDRRKLTSGMRVDTSRGQQRTGMMTGKMPTRSASRHTGRATSSYRPLTTSLTATQTAFSRSTRPLLRYSTSRYLSKPIYGYLYNAQKVNNKWPDYRQCLEYLNLVPSLRMRQAQDKNLTQMVQQTVVKRQPSEVQSIAVSDECSASERGSSPFWFLSNAICYFNLKMHKLAEDYLHLALETNPKYLDPYMWLIKVYLRLNQPLKVLKTCEDGLKNTRSSILYNWKARVQSLLNHDHAAHLSFRESIKYYPTNIEALANVGYYSFYGDKLELSLKCFERIYQLSSSSIGLSGSSGGDSLMSDNCSEAELLNNLALANFYCGHYMKAMPLFQRAFLSSPNKEITSNIWYNISFIPLSFGSRQLAIACLRLALKNDSQNEDAINNLGVLKYDHLINDPLHYGNRQEFWSSGGTQSGSTRSANESANSQSACDFRRQQALFDDAETYFSAPQSDAQLESNFDDEDTEPCANLGSPGMLYNMAVLKRKRGQLLASERYCRMYLESDQNNHLIRSILHEIREFVSHDG
jgi:tetratricopeptide (TPR) repeat protein